VGRKQPFHSTPHSSTMQFILIMQPCISVTVLGLGIYYFGFVNTLVLLNIGILHMSVRDICMGE